MLKNISISGLRGIKQCQLEDLSRINLFFGKNNSGKTTILESVFLLSGQNNPLLPVSLTNIRSGRSFTADDVHVLFYNGNAENPAYIESLTESGIRSLAIFALTKETQEVSSSQFMQTSTEIKTQYGYDYSFSVGEKQGQASITFNDENKESVNKGILRSKSEISEDFFCRYLPSQRSLLPNVVDEYAELLKTKKESELIRALRAIEPNLVDIVVAGNELMVDLGGEKRLPLYVMGDGIRKYLRIIIGIHAAKNGAYLIDEIENGLHFSALKDLWRIVLRESALYNVQIFVTTHDIEVIAALAECAHGDGNAQISAYKIIKQNDGIVKSLRYDKEQLSYMMTQNIEVR